jgi:hypothetical protein
MYARVTRFEGSEPATLKQELGDMRDQMQSGLTDKSIDQMAEQVKGQFERDEVARLLGAIKRTIVLADEEKGSSAMVLFCETEEDARGVDRLFDAMSPGEGGGRRQSADIYAVAIDQTFSM